MRTAGQKRGRKYERSGGNAFKAHATPKSTKPLPFKEKGTQNAYRRTEIQPKKTIGSTKCQPFTRNATENDDRLHEKKPCT